MTEGEKVRQIIHHRTQFFPDHFRQERSADTVRGMEEGEEFAMAHTDIKALLTDLFRNIRRFRFQLGLDNAYVAEKK